MMMNDPLRHLDIYMPVDYLATPYSHPDLAVKEQRFHLVTLVAYYLFSQGRLVYSPITHNVPIDHLGIHGDWQIWSSFDHAMLQRCGRLLILKLDGWRESKGMTAEIAYAQAHHIPIEEMEVPDIVWQWYEEKQPFFIRYRSIQTLSQKINTMVKERGWGYKKTPKNYVMSLAAEVGELIAHFRWLTEAESGQLPMEDLQRVKDEIGDVMINLVGLCDALNIDVLEAGFQKLTKIMLKYPASSDESSH